MPESPYERLSGREGGRNTTASTSSRAGSPVSLARPPTYYGDGPFDPPSSDDEDEDETGSLLEKMNGPTSPGLAELGDGFPSGSGHSDTGDKKVRIVSGPTAASPRIRGQQLTIYALIYRDQHRCESLSYYSFRSSEWLPSLV